MSPRWLIGLGILYVVATIFCNTIDGSAPLTATDMGHIGNTTTVQVQDTVSSTTGIKTGLLAPVAGWLSTAYKILFFDYNFFKDPVTGGDNNWAIVKYIMFWPLTFSLLIQVALLIRQLFLGQ